MTVPVPSDSDLPRAINLTLHSVNEQQLVDDAVAAARVRLPTWQPEPGSIELTLIQAFALLIGQDVYALNRIPTVVLDGIIALNGITRAQPVKAQASITAIMVVGTVGLHVVPAGTTFRITTPGGDVFDAYAFAPAIGNPAVSNQVTVNLLASQAGAFPNGYGPGCTVTTVDSVSWIESATVDFQFSGGADLEADDSFYPRAAAQLRRSSGTLVVEDDYRTAALDVPGIGRAKAFSNWDGNNVATIGADHGYVAVAVAAPDGSACSGPTIVAARQALTARAVADLSVNVINPHFTPVTVTVDVKVADGFTAADVQTRTAAAIRAALSPATRGWGAALPANYLIGLVASVPGVALVNTVGGASVGAAATVVDLPAANPTITVTAS